VEGLGQLKNSMTSYGIEGALVIYELKIRLITAKGLDFNNNKPNLLTIKYLPP
jgi:hypothetical protein